MSTSQLARPWLAIDTAAIVANARALASRVRPAALCAVIKSDAYGHGLVPVGRALDASGIAGLRLAVFSATEALALRAAGVAAPVLILGPVSDDEVPAAVSSGVELAVLDAGDARRFPAGTAVHLKVDTGIARFGVAPVDAARVIEACENGGLRVAGVYSHLANAEDLDRALTDRQAACLSSVPLPAGTLRHLAASAAAIMWPQTRFDMVRCGIALFGHWPSALVKRAPESQGLHLQRALAWRAPVVQVREIEPGDTVGYGCEFVAARRTKVAVLPLGYADGLPRAASAGSLELTIRGARAPLIGRICMNASMLDVTNISPEVVRGDVAEIDVDDVARASGSINYEVLARLPGSLERRYA